jgi:hypothetical protein
MGGKSKELCKTEDKKSFLFSWERKPPLLKGLRKMVATLATQLDWRESLHVGRVHGLSSACNQVFLQVNLVSVSRNVIVDTGSWFVNHTDIVLLVYPRPVLLPPLFCLCLTESLPAIFTEKEMTSQELNHMRIQQEHDVSWTLAIEVAYWAGFKCIYLNRTRLRSLAPPGNAVRVM